MDKEETNMENITDMDFTLNEQISEVFESLGYDAKYMFLSIADEIINSIMIMEKSAKAFIRLYWYDDDNKVLYLECLAVNVNYRQLGFGNELLGLAENIVLKLGFEKIQLMVETESWMYNWYSKNGYEFLEYDEKSNFSWMEKIL